MHFWIDKRSSQLHNFGGGGRGRPPGSGGFYSNFLFIITHCITLLYYETTKLEI